MIPIRLELRNFMSYGDQVTPLEFTGLRLACLSGDNGNGKSALLDAITWALWGEARAPADELIRLGADEMRVVFDFRLGDDIYRVIRGRSKRASGNVWELYIAENADEILNEQLDIADSPDHSTSSTQKLVWRSLTGQGIRDTARIIQRILRMDYKTFINSAYIQQGRADEFAKQTVTDRKKILADILDLSRYDVLEQKAKDRRNEMELRAQELEKEIVHIEQELANEQLWKTEISTAQSERERVASYICKVETRLHELQTKKAKLEETAKRIDELNQQIASCQKEIKSLEERFI
ncbi:MAG: AAA family ATPase, partial [Armatimonadota bacterium]